ncbi:MAG: hypothetical protein PHO33_04045, partial [Clostridia bacterium]|nr:hypothetical protein [Clostridia bacterium]
VLKRRSAYVDFKGNTIEPGEKYVDHRGYLREPIVKKVYEGTEEYTETEDVEEKVATAAQTNGRDGTYVNFGSGTWGTDNTVVKPDGSVVSAYDSTVLYEPTHIEHHTEYVTKTRKTEHAEYSGDSFYDSHDILRQPGEDYYDPDGDFVDSDSGLHEEDYEESYSIMGRNSSSYTESYSTYNGDVGPKIWKAFYIITGLFILGCMFSNFWTGIYFATIIAVLIPVVYFSIKFLVTRIFAPLFRGISSLFNSSLFESIKNLFTGLFKGAVWLYKTLKTRKWFPSLCLATLLSLAITSVATLASSNIGVGAFGLVTMLPIPLLPINFAVLLKIRNNRERRKFGEAYEDGTAKKVDGRLVMRTEEELKVYKNIQKQIESNIKAMPDFKLEKINQRVSEQFEHNNYIMSDEIKKGLISKEEIKRIVLNSCTQRDSEEKEDSYNNLITRLKEEKKFHGISKKGTHFVIDKESEEEEVKLNKENER